MEGFIIAAIIVFTFMMARALQYLYVIAKNQVGQAELQKATNQSLNAIVRLLKK